ncbi:ASKHA domain-containing protein [Planobispora rosea]|uniref:ASKHA domain-containing protein n=1 Tax=Planobispora rosea TaxID=35762 RepID=UPI0009FD6D69|nr:ASKHA domain-containing protein [Planobispora rosea]
MTEQGPAAGRGPGTGRDTGSGRVRLRLLAEGRPPREVSVPPGVSVFEAASWNGVAIDSTCGGHGTCRKCRIRVTARGADDGNGVSATGEAGDPGDLGEAGDPDGAGCPVPVSRLDPRAFGPEQLREGWRLACLARAVSDLEVEIPPLATRPKAATVGVGRQVILRPAVQKRYVELAEPTLADQTPDLERLLAALDDLEPVPDLHAVRAAGKVMRAADFKVTAVVVDDVLIDVEPGDTSGSRYGVAFDLGTTTVVATLLDLSSGTPVAVRSMLNLQQPSGADVISRISATMLDPSALDRLRDAARETMDQLAREVCEEGGVSPGHIYEVALAGNATMVQLALGIDPEPLGVAPFVMATRALPALLASDLGLRLHPRARAVVLPALGAYVGGDIVAGVLASGMDRDRRLRLFIDVGTNCEIVLGPFEGRAGRLLATAAPAGPAFEGAQIRCGMRASAGAIETVRLTPSVELGVIGDVAPAGLCGSGLVDAVAELLRVGLLDRSGRFVPEAQAVRLAPELAGRLTTVGGERVFTLAGDVFLSQRDVRELQFAKAAIATGWRLLLAEYGAAESEIQQVLLAGSFGSYLSPASAVRVGLVPDLALPRIVSAGNVAGEGAKLALLSVQERAGALALLEEIHYVELSDRPDFNDRFVDLLAF